VTLAARLQAVVRVAREVDAALQADGDYQMRWHELIELAPRLRVALEELDRGGA